MYAAPPVHTEPSALPAGQNHWRGGALQEHIKVSLPVEMRLNVKVTGQKVFTPRVASTPQARAADETLASMHILIGTDHSIDRSNPA
jgi:hypothetical protein